jgi:SAM-dependent methyltransferase
LRHTVAIPICPLCGAGEQARYAEFAEFVWVKCSCGLIFKKSVAGTLLDTVVGGEGSFGEAEYGQRYARRYRHRVAKSVRQLEDARAFLTEEAASARQSILDVGCSLGSTLEAARQLGMVATGVDVSQTAVDACRRLGFEADVAGLEKLPYPDAQFLIVVMKHVLEHTRDPALALREAKRVLKPGGVLFIAVPHADYRKAVARPASSRFYRPDAHGGLEHWVYYTPTTLAGLLTKAGMTVVRTRPVLMHPRVSAGRRSVEVMAYPFRRLWERMLTGFRLRKEFWIVCTRTQGSDLTHGACGPEKYQPL